MTDRKKLIELLDSAGIEWGEDGEDIVVYSGYVGFFTDFEFDANGKLLKMGAWE
jgi:hypothetical protein